MKVMLLFLKNVKFILVTIFCLSVLISCKNSYDINFKKIETSNDSVITTVTTAESILQTESVENFYDFMYDKINLCLNEYRTLYTDNKIIILSFEFNNLSTEGGTIKFYGNNDGLLRINVLLRGELGQTEINLYSINNSQTYYTKLISNYSCHIADIARNDLPTDILYYNFNEYFIMNNVHYQIDHINNVTNSCESQLSNNILSIYEEIKTILFEQTLLYGDIPSGEYEDIIRKYFEENPIE